MKKSWWIFLAIILSSVLVLSACGTASDNEEDTTEPEEETEVEVDEEETEVDEEDTNATEEDAVDEEADEEAGTEEDSEAEEETNEETADSEDEEPQVVEENEAFRIFEPEPNSIVDNEFTVCGEARVFEGTVHYEFEDGHFILDEGTVTASAGAPEWGEFEITINFDEVSNDTGMVILYEESAKDGSRENQLIIPVKVEN